MTAPASAHAETRESLAVLTEVYGCLLELAREAHADAQSADHATADHRRPLGTGARPTTTQDGYVHALDKRDVAAQEASQHEAMSADV